MDYLDLAKCGLLEQVYRSTTGLPLWQSVTVATLFVGSTLIGVLLAFRYRRVPTGSKIFRHSAAAILCLTLLAATVAVVIGGFQYLVFLLRMSKDTLFCTWFEGSRTLTLTQILALGLVSLVNIGLATSYGLDHWGPQPLARSPTRRIASWFASALLICAAYTIGIMFA